MAAGSKTVDGPALPPSKTLATGTSVTDPAIPNLALQAAVEESRMKSHPSDMVQKLAVTLNPNSVADLDRWVREGRYPNRSKALQSAVDYFIEREKRMSLLRELDKLDSAEERSLAEEGLGDESWPNVSRP